LSISIEELLSVIKTQSNADKNLYDERRKRNSRNESKESKAKKEGWKGEMQIRKTVIP